MAYFVIVHWEEVDNRRPSRGLERGSNCPKAARIIELESELEKLRCDVEKVRLALREANDTCPGST